MSNSYTSIMRLVDSLEINNLNFFETVAKIKGKDGLENTDFFVSAIKSGFFSQEFLSDRNNIIETDAFFAPSVATNILVGWDSILNYSFYKDLIFSDKFIREEIKRYEDEDFLVKSRVYGYVGDQISRFESICRISQSIEDIISNFKAIRIIGFGDILVSDLIEMVDFNREIFGEDKCILELIETTPIEKFIYIQENAKMMSY